MPGTHRVGGGLTPPVPPHHRTYGSVSGGSPQYRSARYLPVRLTSPCSLNHWLLMASFACGLPAIRHQPDDRSRPACAPAQCRGAGVIPALSGCLRRTGRPGEVVGPRRSGPRTWTATALAASATCSAAAWAAGWARARCPSTTSLLRLLARMRGLEAWDGMHPLEKAFLITSALSSLGDIGGGIYDRQKQARDEERDREDRARAGRSLGAALSRPRM